MFYDPLGYLGLPFFEKEVVEIALKYGYRALPFHFHEVVLSAIAYNTIYSLSKVISPLMVKSYRSMTRRNQINFDIHVVSMVQSIAILLLSIPLFNDPVLSKDRVSGYTPYAGFVVAMAVGYFLWDTYICLRFYHMFGFGFLLHGIGSLFVFMQGLRPYVMYYCPIFLLFELSTPFVNIHWFAGHLPSGVIPEFVQKINGAILLVTFPACRILWGFYQAFQLGCDVFDRQQQKNQQVDYPGWLPYSLVIANVAMDILNLYWYYKMIKAVKRRLRQNVSEPLVEKKTS